MNWIKGLLNNATEIGKLIFTIMVLFGAIKNMAQHKMISIILFLIAAGLLGWIVNNNTDAITKLSELFKGAGG